MASSELLDLVFHGREERNLEYKESLNWNDPETKLKITKSILAMANIRDGGAIVLGVDKSGVPRGMNSGDAESFNLDHVLAKVNEYADPFVDFGVKTITDNNKTFVVIQVQEFDQLPVVCKSDGGNKNKIYKGEIYTRSRRMPETVKVSSQTEMREIIDLATEKGIRRLLATQSRIGISITTLATSRDLFQAQIDEIEKKLSQDMYPNGYWLVKIHPKEFAKNQIPSLAKCKDIILDSVVSLRGLSYPYADRQYIRSGQDWVELGTPERLSGDFWRFYQSAQFIHRFDMLENQLPDSKLRLSQLSTLYTFTEIFEFASRLAEKANLETGIEISVKLVGTKNRMLWEQDASPFAFLERRVAQVNEILIEKAPSYEQLIAQRQELALEATMETFERFNWDHPPIKLYAEEQKKFIERRI